MKIKDIERIVIDKRYIKFYDKKGNVEKWANDDLTKQTIDYLIMSNIGILDKIKDRDEENGK
jgi:hypothetical protein